MHVGTPLGGGGEGRRHWRVTSTSGLFKKLK